ncbi:hypothetical protein BGX38DRAFT_460973 [Terfezia claveryi]|nr:hypothetical protein BGX38DRAFT_460973 [Terfezia claveryi]
METPPPTIQPPNRTRAVIFHADPMKYKPGLMRRWIEEDNKGFEFWVSGCCKKVEGLVNWRRHSLSTWHTGLTLHTDFAWVSESSASQNTTGTDDFLHQNTLRRYDTFWVSTWAGFLEGFFGTHFQAFSTGEWFYDTFLIFSVRTSVRPLEVIWQKPVNDSLGGPSHLSFCFFLPLELLSLLFVTLRYIGAGPDRLTCLALNPPGFLGGSS